MLKNALIFSACLFLIGGCAQTPSIPTDKNDISASAELLKFKESKKDTSAIVEPSIIMPAIEEKMPEKNISVSADDVNLKQALYAISRTSGMNIVIGSDVDVNTKITFSLNKTPVKEVLDTVSELGGCSYIFKNNIVYVSKYVQKTFQIPYTQTQTSFDSTLGGDVLGAAQSSSGGEESGGSSGLKGKYGLNYKNTPESTNFYKQLEKNIQDLLSKDGKYTLNVFTGTLVVTDTKKNVEAVGNFLKKVKKTTSRQVVIDAKILEVVLNNSHQLGVDWETLPSAGDFVFKQTLGLSGAVAGTLSYSDKHMSAIVKALDTAGDIDALSNPKITVSSGQSALISSGKIMPFWEKEVSYTNSGGVGTPSTPIVTYKRRDILDGLSLGVTPTITEDKKIILNIVPITSNIEETVNFTDNSSGSSDVIASAPILSIKEAGTIINANDNEIVMIGGLISNTKKKNIKKIPLLGDIPGLGKAFEQVDTKDEKRELVIILKLNIIEN